MTTRPGDVDRHIRDILHLAIRHDGAAHKALVVYDRDSPLSRLLEGAYRAALPGATFLDFATAGAEGTRAAIDALAPGDFVGLVQSHNFRLDDFRVRIELFKRQLTTVEHGHLSRLPPEQEQIYIDSLAYDPAYYIPLGQSLKARLDAARSAEVLSEGARLTYATGFEPAKLNVGDYRALPNVGGTFPIGEVFTEPTDLGKVDGEAMIFAFSGLDHLIQVPPPFRLRIEGGYLADVVGAPRDFQDILAKVRATERLLVREFGLGLNPAMHKGRVIGEITAFERMKGLHLSIGEKHTVYKKAGINAKRTRFHIDVFVDVQRIDLDGVPVFEAGEYRV